MNRWLSVLFFAAILTSPAFGQPQSTLEKVKTTKTMAIGYREASLPFSFLGSDGKPVGYSIELCALIAASIQQQLGLSDLQIKWIPVTPENRMAMVTNGTVDLECGSTSNTLSRQEQVDFSHLTFVDGASLLISTGSNIRRLADIAGKRVAVIAGTTTEKALAEALQRANLSV